jgi:tRNA(Ile)-lysidine synthetase-like protein
MSQLIDQVRAFADRYELLLPDSTVVVAVSGGPDSLCLLDLLQRLSHARRLTLHVAHLDHRLRDDSADDARFVAAIAAGMSLPATIEAADVAALARERRGGIEEAARAARLTLLENVARSINADRIALGHNADDQAETVLLRLLRGAGPSGLAAMRPRRLMHADDPDSPWIIRPLLDTPRAAIEAYCAERGLTPRRDATNALPIHLRNRVRGYILPALKPYNPNIVATLGRTARVCAEEDDLLSELTERAWREHVRVDGEGISIDRSGFESLHPALRRRLMRRAAEAIVGGLEARHLDLLLAAIAANRRRAQLPGGGWLRIGNATLRLSGRQGATDA